MLKKFDFKVIPLMDYIITLVGSHESYKFLLINSNKFTNNSIFFYIYQVILYSNKLLYFFFFWYIKKILRYKRICSLLLKYVYREIASKAHEPICKHRIDIHSVLSSSSSFVSPERCPLATFFRLLYEFLTFQKCL